MKKKFNNRIKSLTGLLFSVVAFMAFAPILGVTTASIIGVAFIALQFVPMPKGILGTNAPLNLTEDELISKFKDTIDSKWKSLIDSSAEFKKVKELETKMEQFKFIAPDQLKSNEDFKKLVGEVDKTILELKAIKETPQGREDNSFSAQVAKALEVNKAAIEAMKTSRSASVNLVIKAAGTFTTGNVTPVGSGISGILNQVEPGITVTPRSQPFFMDLLNIGRTTGSTYSYAEMKNNDGGAGMTAEGAAKTQADFDIVEAKATVRKVTSYMKTSKEALEDIAGLQSEINNELVTLIKLKADSQLLSGDNTGQNLNGVITQATAYASGSLAGTITDPNNFDVLAAAVNQIMVAEVLTGVPAGFMPTAIILNPADFMAMKLTKDETGQYLFPVILPGVSQVINVPIVVSAYMTAGEFLVGDFTKAYVKIREDVNISIGYENDDFTKNLITILAEMRLAFFIKSNHAKAFVTGDFATAIAELEVAPAP